MTAWVNPSAVRCARVPSKGGKRLSYFLVILCAVEVQPVVHLGAPLAADEGPTRHVFVTDCEGRVRTGLLTAMDSGHLTLGNIEQVKLLTKNQRVLKVRDRTSIIGATDSLVILASGDMLVLGVETIDDESLTARWVRFPTWPAVKLSLETVRGVLMQRPEGQTAGARLLNQVLASREAQDAVILNNGDLLVGEFAGLDDKHLALQMPQGKSSIERTGIKAVIFNQTLTNSDPLKGEGALVSLTDGSRFRARDLKFGALDRLTLRTLFGAVLDLPLSAVESLRFLGGCATYLSDLTAAEYKFEPFLELDWPLRRDQTVVGGFLSLRGVEYPKGLGVHSRSAVTYRLDGKFRRFHATIGVDDDTGGKGSVVFEALVDGKTAYKSEVLTGSSAPVVIERVDVSGAKLLTLRVDYATAGDIQDHADWCDALLVK